MWKHVSYRRTGLRHTEEHSACQDAVQVVECEGWIVAALADGVSSLQNSHVASQTAVKYVCAFFDGKKSLGEEGIRSEIMLPQIQKAIADQARAENIPVNEMDCTLVFVAIDKRKLRAYVGTLGDSAACMIGSEQSVVYSDSTFSAIGTSAVMSAKSSEQLQIQTVDLKQKPVLGFILTSDGLEGEVYTKGSTHVKKTAEYYINTLACNRGQEQACQLISQRIDKLTLAKDSTYDDDISIAVLCCAEQPVSLPDDPTWLCVCGQRNPLQTTYCRRCHADFIKVYPNIRFREHGGKAAFFVRLNQDAQKEAEMIAALKTSETKAEPSHEAKGASQPQQPIEASEGKAGSKLEQSAEAVQKPEKDAPQSKSEEDGTVLPLGSDRLAPKEKAQLDEQRSAPVEERPEAASTQPKNLVDASRGNRNQKQSSLISRMIISHLPECLIVLAVILLTAIFTVSVIANRAGREEGYNRGKMAGVEQGYSIGFSDGVLSGMNLAQNKYQTDYDAAVLRAEQAYSQRYLEHYQAGYEQGKKDADFVPQDFKFKSGSRGDEVRVLQQLLRNRGWEIHADGQYGPATGKAVAEFQQQNALPVTGETDILTFWALLNEENAGWSDSEDPQLPQSEIASKPVPEPREEPASPSDIPDGDA